jgi:hypothetical protein
MPMPNVSASTSLQPIMLLLATLTVLPPAATAGDWPQVLGPVRTGIAAADERLAAATPAWLWPRAGCFCFTVRATGR